MNFMIRIIFYPDRSRINRHLQVPIFCRVTIAGSRLPFSTGVWCNPDHWKDGCINHPDAVADNAMLSKIRNELNIAFAQLIGKNTPRAIDVVNLMRRNNRPESDPSISELMRAWVDHKLKSPDIQEQTKARLQVRVERLLKFTGNIRSSAITPELLAQIGSQPGYKYSYLHKLIQYLRSATAWGYCNNILPIDRLNGARIKAPSFEIKTSLTPIQLRVLADTPMTGACARARDLFLFQCFTGIAFTDLNSVTWESLYMAAGRTWIRINRKKTGKTSFPVLTKEAAEILKRYDYRLRAPSNAVYNRNLKRVARICRISNNLTSHLGRKTFIQHYLNSGVPVDLIASMAGNTSRVLLQHYGTINEKVIDAALRASGM